MNRSSSTCVKHITQSGCQGYLLPLVTYLAFIRNAGRDYRGFTRVRGKFSSSYRRGGSPLTLDSLSKCHCWVSAALLSPVAVLYSRTTTLLSLLGRLAFITFLYDLL